MVGDVAGGGPVADADDVGERIAAGRRRGGRRASFDGDADVGALRQRERLLGMKSAVLLNCVDV